MSVRGWVLAVAAVFGLTCTAWAQGPGGGGRQCGGGCHPQMQQMRTGGPGVMQTGGGQLQSLQLQQLQAQQAQLQMLQAQMLALQLGDADAIGRANFARMQAARKAKQQAKLQAEK
jgi:hypothetical protein